MYRLIIETVPYADNMTMYYYMEKLGHGAGEDSTLSNIPANTKHLYNICAMLDHRRRRWADVVQMFCVSSVAYYLIVLKTDYI